MRTIVRTVAAVGLLLTMMAGAAKASLADCHAATCKITQNGGARGTGCAFWRDKDRIFVLTNAHVVGNAQAVQCEFWYRGHKSRPIRGTVIARVRNQACDAAVLALRVADFGAYPPKIIPLAPLGSKLSPNAMVLSVGCANGAWATSWQGHVLRHQGSRVRFRPSPAGGRSGSAIFNASGTQIVGLLFARDQSRGEGLAVSLDALYRHLTPGSVVQKIVRTAAAVRDTIDIQCPNGGCLPFGGGGLFGRDNRQPEAPPQPYGGSPYPNVPPPAAEETPEPPAPAVDLSPISDKLDNITAILQEMRAEQVAPPLPQLPAEPAEPEGPTPDELIQANSDGLVALGGSVEQVATEVAGVRNDVDAASATVASLNTAVAENAVGLTAVKENVVNATGGLKERFDARLEKVRGELGEEAGKSAVAVAYLKDYVKERLFSGTLLAGAPGGLALALLLFVIYRVKTGDSLIEKLWDRLGDIRDRLHDRANPAPASQPTPPQAPVPPVV